MLMLMFLIWNKNVAKVVILNDSFEQLSTWINVCIAEEN